MGMRRFDGDPWNAGKPTATPTFAPQLEGTELLGVQQQPKRAQSAPRPQASLLGASSGSGGASSMIATGVRLLSDFLKNRKQGSGYTTGSGGPALPSTGGDYKKGGAVKGKTENTKTPQIPKGTPGGGNLKVKKGK